MKILPFPLEALAAVIVLGMSLAAVPAISSGSAGDSLESDQLSSSQREPFYVNQLPKVSYVDFPSAGSGVTIINSTTELRKVLLDGLRVKQSPHAEVYLDEDKRHSDGGVDVLIDTSGLCHLSVGKIDYLDEGSFALQRVNDVNDVACPVTQKHLTATDAVRKVLWSKTPVKIARISHGAGAADTFVVGHGHYALEFEKLPNVKRITWNASRKPSNP